MTEIYPHTTDEENISSQKKISRLKRSLLTYTQTAKVQVLSLLETPLSCSSFIFFLSWSVFQQLGFFYTKRERVTDLTLAAGVADTSAPEVIIIHSQSQYCCVVKTRTILTSVHLSCRDSYIRALAGHWQFFYRSASPLQKAAILPWKVRCPSVWMIKLLRGASW